MENIEPIFILAGNGPYENRGCEAIVRGTTKILREHFTDPRFVCLSNYQSRAQYQEQCLRETDDAIDHIPSCMLSREAMIRGVWKPKTWYKLFQYINDRGAFTYSHLLPYLQYPGVSVGGIITLTGSIPLHHFMTSCLHERPMMIWGASIGPFTSNPSYERHTSNHPGIFRDLECEFKFQNT